MSSEMLEEWRRLSANWWEEKEEEFWEMWTSNTTTTPLYTFILLATLFIFIRYVIKTLVTLARMAAALVILSILAYFYFHKTD